MRFLNSLWIGLCVALAGCSTVFAQSTANENIAASWHFAGAARLADDTNAANAKAIFAQKSSIDFKDLVLTRFSVWLSDQLQFSNNPNSPRLLRPLLDDLLSSESSFAVGGKGPGPLNFILAIQLDDARAQIWQNNLRQALGTPGKSVSVNGFTGQSWDRAGANSFWIVPGRHWLFVGVGEYLWTINQTGTPSQTLDQSWLEADVDWPRLAAWLPTPPFDLKPARMQITMTTKAGTLRLKAKVTYPQPLSWKFKPWQIPTNLVSNPLVSFTAGQDVAALMTTDEPLSKLTDNPLASEFFLWAMGIEGMPFQSYAAWPVDNPTNTLERIASEAPAAFNPDLAERHGGELTWFPQAGSLVWGKLATFLSPTLQAAPATNGPFLLASLFPLAGKNPPPPAGLFDQFTGLTNLVFYDWELTTPRLQHWRLLSAMLPIYPPLPAPTNSAGPTNGAPRSKTDVPPIVVEENWLAGLATLDNTVTEVTLTGPAELTVLRKSPFVFNSLELVMLSHWLSGTGSPGIIPSLLPPRAKMSGPGIPPNTP